MVSNVASTESAARWRISASVPTSINSPARRIATRSLSASTSPVEVEGNHVRCQVVGSVEPLLGVLAASGLHQLLSREPSLEELFLAHYGRAPDSRTPAVHER